MNIENGVLKKVNNEDIIDGKITIPENVTSIGDGTFEGWYSLRSIEIPESVTSIGDGTFYSCHSLRSIEIPESVTSIGAGAFNNCWSLESIEIPDSVTSIGDRTFEDCSNLTSIEIPESVTRIGDGAFSACSRLRRIEIPESVTSIGVGAFDGCSSLTNIIIPEGVTSIGDGTFDGCSSLTNITIPKSVTSIGEEAFRGCSNLTSIEIPEEVTSIGNSAFSGCSSLTNITIPESVTSIGAGAFNNCWSLRSIEIPDSVTSIGNGTFYGCSSLTNITIPESVTSIGARAFEDCSNLTSIEIPEGVTSIGEEAFEYCSSLTSIEIPGNVTSIENSAFRSCSSLTSIEIPDNVTRIGDSAFSGCSSLTSIEIPESVTSIGDRTFEDCSNLTSIEIPDSVTRIGYSAFSGCSSLTSIEIPDNVTSIGEEAFKYCSSLTSIEIPESVTSIGDGTFGGCRRLISIEIPDNVTRIGDGTFGGCSSLTSIEIPDNVTRIGDRAFSGCSSLTSIEIPESVTSIGVGAFDGCRSLRSIEIPESVTSIGAGAFNYCRSLRSIEIPEGVTEIGDYAFSNCSNLTEITIPIGIEHISKKAFEYCENLKTLKIVNGDKVTNIVAPKDFKSIELVETPFGKVICVVGENIANNEIFFKSQEELVKAGYIKEDLSQEEKDKAEIKIKDQIGRILKNNTFSHSRDYNAEYGIQYINKMIDILGLEETENMLRIPENISEEEIQTHGESLLKVYSPKYKMQGNIPTVVSIIENIDTIISKNSENVGRDRIKVYTKINELLEKGENLKLSEIIKICSKEIGIEIDESIAKKYGKEIQTKQLTSKKEEIVSKIRQKVSNPEEHINHRGIISGLIYNVIRNTIIEDETVEQIEENLEKEINKRRANGEQYYGASIQEQKEEILRLVKSIYEENEELLKTNSAEILSQTKDGIGKGWIRKLQGIKKGIGDLEELTEEEKVKLEENLRENGIEQLPQYEKKHERNAEISNEEAYKILTQLNLPEILTYEKAEMMFSSMQEPYSKDFAKWFIAHKKEIMENADYYANIAVLHNEFERILENSETRAVFDNGRLSVQGAFNILRSREKQVGEGNEELGKKAEKLDIGEEKLKEAEDIFEITKKREASYIPTAKAAGIRYRGRILRADDPMNILAGNATDCCQKVGDVGAGSMEHGSTKDNGRIFVIEKLDEKGKVVKVVTQSWVWRNKDRICFDNIEVPLAEQPVLKYSYSTGDIEAQKEIIEIYRKCAESLIKKDEEMFEHLMKAGKITKEQYEALVLKDVTIGTGYNDLGVLEKSELEEVSEEDMILPAEYEQGDSMWVDSGGQDGKQLYLAKGKNARNRDVSEQNLEDIPVLYRNEREVRELKGDTIDKGVVRQIREIEEKVYREQQHMLGKCTDYKDIAEIYEMEEDNIEVKISREKDWYMIYEEREEEVYIADIAAVNGVNAEKRGEQATEVFDQTLEMTEAIYEVMLQAAEGGKKVTLNATEDTSYKNIMKMCEKGLIEIEEDETRIWEKYNNSYDNDEYYDDDETSYEDKTPTEEVTRADSPEEKEIVMHDMVIKVNKEKLEEELKRIRELKEKRRETRDIRYLEGK